MSTRYMRIWKERNCGQYFISDSRMYAVTRSGANRELREVYRSPISGTLLLCNRFREDMQVATGWTALRDAGHWRRRAMAMPKYREERKMLIRRARECVEWSAESRRDRGEKLAEITAYPLPKIVSRLTLQAAE